MSAQGTKTDVKNKPKGGHEESKSPRFRQEKQAISLIKGTLKDCKVSLPDGEAKKQHASGSKQNKTGKLPTQKKDKDTDDDDVTVIRTEIQRIMDEVKALQADVRSYRQTSESILEIKELLTERLQSMEEISKGTNQTRQMQTDQKKKTTDQKGDDHVNNNITVIKTEITRIKDDLKRLETDIQSLLSLAQQAGSERQNEKDKKKRKETKHQEKVTARQALEKIQAILQDQMKQTDPATSKREVLGATNQKNAKKENEKMINCLLKITGPNAYTSNGTDIEMLTKESQKVVENLNETARLYEKQEKEKEELLKLVQEKTPVTYDKIKSKEGVKKDSSSIFPNLICEVIEMAVNPRGLESLKKEHRTMKTFLLTYTHQDQQTSKPEEVNIDELVKTSDGVKHKTQEIIRSHENFRKDILTKTESAVQYAKYTNRPQQFNLENNSKDNDVIQFNASLSKLLKCLDEDKTNFENKMVNEIKILKEENEGLQTRLSKVAGSRLTEGNPSITNLGDPNRPMKIAEMYSELYDNEWTDMMDKFENAKKKQKGPKVLQALYSTLVGCYQLCITKSTALEEKVKEIIQSAAKVFMIKGLEEEVINQAKPMRKQHAETAAEQLLKEIRSPKDQSAMKHLKVDKDVMKDILPTVFFEKCIKLCWMMIMQDPPMILQEGPKPGSTYDRNIFREYTSSGTKVEFTIWPALMLNEGGPLLVKGVVSVK